MAKKENANKNSIKVGISHGDINGVGYEIIIKTFMDKRILENITPIIFGSSKAASYHRKALGIEFNLNLIKYAKNAVDKRTNIVNIIENEVKIELGKSTPTAGELSFLSLEKATKALQDNEIDVLVTAPINKNNIQSDSFAFPGHTEYLAKKFDQQDDLMLMISDTLRIGIITNHLPLKDVSAAITEELILSKARILQQSLQKDFAIQKPRIAVLSINPHAGDNGLLGTEEQEVIIPAIKKANKEGLLLFGPYPADGLFGSGSYKKFDAILSMYHDQGMLPFKTIAFDSGVNYTAGLPVVRTSPAHGTAYDIAGKGFASPDSFREAVYLACDIYKNRKEYEALKNNSLSESTQNSSRETE